MMWITSVLCVLGCVCAGYVGFLALCSLLYRKPELEGCFDTSFWMVIPAHNESLSVAETVQNVLKVEYPQHRFKIWVVADNCTDATAQIARDAGACVWERMDPERKSKGYALHDFFAWALGQPGWDACVVVDADTVVQDTLLQSYAALIKQGHQVLQAEYAVKNPHDSWRTGLMAVAFAMFHKVRNRGRSFLGVSVGLRGNGMCFTRAVLKAYPYQAYGLVEDVEYAVTLALHGIAVGYAHNVSVWGDMVSEGKHSVSQRHRWEDGRKSIRKTHALKLWKAFKQKPSLLLWDMLCDVCMPPLASAVVYFLLGVCVWMVFPSYPVGWLLLGTFLGLVAYVVQGMVLSGLGWKSVKLMCMAPWYVLWKMLHAEKTPKKTSEEETWVRTYRRGET